MAGAGGVFHVTFGINETELTRALESQQYDVASRIIRENSYTSFLDEGCYQRTPLYLCLCGHREDEVTPLPRNLQLACMLAQYGAAVNYRVPTTFYGCEYMGPGKSSLELVVELFNAITMHPCHGLTPYDLEREHIIGRSGEHLTRRREILQELLDTAFILLTHGGDPGIVDDHHQSLLHRTAVYSGDPRMLYLLCENTDSHSMVDRKGNTVLGSLCDGFPLGVEEFLANQEANDTDPYAQCCHLQEKGEFIDYLLSLPDVDVNHQNHRGRTALWHCTVRGDMVNAGKLLSAGCDASLQGQLREGHGTRSVSPLLASMCSVQNIPAHTEKYIANVPVHTHFLAHLVDQGFFNTPAILAELHKVIDDDFSEFRYLKCLEEKLLSLMFGGASSTLRQLCTRTIFQQAFLSPQSRALQLLHPNNITEKFNFDSYVSAKDFAVYINELVTDDTLELLVASVQLPSDAVLYFQVELFRQRLGSRLRRCEWFRYVHPDSDTESEGDADSDGSSDMNDSDLEYW